jgi:hypothetical protein
MVWVFEANMQVYNIPLFCPGNLEESIVSTGNTLCERCDEREENNKESFVLEEGRKAKPNLTW